MRFITVFLTPGALLINFIRIIFMNKSCIFRFSNVKEKVKVAFTFNKSLKPQIKGMPQTTNCDNSKRSAYIIAIDNGSNE